MDDQKKMNKKILWVDDYPNNNIYERSAFKAVNYQIELALSTDEAIEKLRMKDYGAIISDMGRKEGHKEGILLLEKIRDIGIKTPYFIYTTANNVMNDKNTVNRLGAQGITNDPYILFNLVNNCKSPK